MKRRNAECGKLRRPLKRSKITEGIYGSTFMYVKFVMVWALVLLADFILEFRFEYLWPFWLLLRSVSDSFKYQGLAFSVFFVCVAVTSDVICYIFIPVQWLFFAASTYVWVQYVWHTERGVCLPTVSLWLLFVYIEASVRLREFKSLPFHLDLCRPFAAHCIGYPVVTLGFGFKSYVSYRMRVRKQKDVQKENEFYIQLLQQALPSDQQTTDKQKALPCKSQEEVVSNSELPSTGVKDTPPSQPSQPLPTQQISTKKSNKDAEREKERAAIERQDSKDNKKTPTGDVIEDYAYVQQSASPPKHRHNVNDYEPDDAEEQHVKSYKQANGVPRNNSKLNSQQPRDITNSRANSKQGKNINNKSDSSSYTNNKEECVSDKQIRLESDVKRLKVDLQSSRANEHELRSQVNNLIIDDKTLRSELYQLRQDNESLQNKLHNLVTSRQQDKASLAAMDKKLQDERKTRSKTEETLSQERKTKKAEEQAQARAVAMAQARGECTESCKSRRREAESEMKQTRRELMLREDQIRQLERETQTLRQYQDAQNETEVLMSALAAMQDKNTHLENSLSAETRLKLDLFSALGEAKRQIEIQQNLLLRKDVECAELKSKVAEVMALMPYNSPPVSVATPSHTAAQLDLSPHFSGGFSVAASLCRDEAGHGQDVLAKSSLNPNASDYTPITK